MRQDRPATRPSGRLSAVTLSAVVLVASLSAVVLVPAAASARVARAASAQDVALARVVDRYSAHLGIQRSSLAQIEAAKPAAERRGWSFECAESAVPV